MVQLPYLGGIILPKSECIFRLCMFINRTSLLLNNPMQLNYGIAVTDLDNDGLFEFIVAGFGFPNRAYKWTGDAFIDIASRELADMTRQSIGVAAADIDGDGEEELYVLNTDTFHGQKKFADRLFDFSEGGWIDLFTLPMHREVLNLTAGRSVIAVDRDGDGLYGFFVANYGGPMRLYELNEDGVLQDVALSVGVALTTGGRAAVSLPLVSDRMDIFASNENGPNFLFRNRGDGTFEEIAERIGLSDPFQHGRGVAVLDSNGDGRLDLVCGNWEGAHRLFERGPNGIFRDVAPPHIAAASRVRTVIAADFDNDGYEEIFFNNIGEPNRLFAWRDGHWMSVGLGDALEPNGLGTGAAVGDFDSDGWLELVIAHGESGFQPLAYYQTMKNDNNWLRVKPITRYGAPARGAVVTLFAQDRRYVRVIDAGSGYLCQMEPIAHFGLGSVQTIERVIVQWPDGQQKIIAYPQPCQTITVQHPQTF